MSQLFSGKDNHIEYHPFDADAKYRVPTMQNRFGKFDGLFTKKLFYHQGFFAVKRRVVFILGAKWIHVAPRLFLCFLFLIPLTIRQNCLYGEI